MKKFTKGGLWMITLLFSFTIFWSHAQKAIDINPTDEISIVYPTPANLNTGTVYIY